MRICLVAQEYPPDTARGGIGTQTWNKARWLTRLGHQMHVLSASASRSTDVETRVEDDVTVHRLPPPSLGLALYQPETYWLGYSWAVFGELRRLVERVGFDLIDFPEYGGEGFVYLLDRTVWDWIPVVVQLHGPLSMFAERIGWPEPSSVFARIGSMMEELAIRRADALMACSANIADFTASRHGVPRAAIDVVHCGVDTEAFRPGPPAEREGRPTVLFVGNIAENKGVGTTLEAVLRLRARHPDIRLQIAGKPEEEPVAALRERIARAGAEANVELLGFVGRSELPALYRGAHLFASPAYHEVGVANVYIEAMACGCPVVAAGTGGAPEAIRDGESGLLVPPGDAGATATAIDRLLSDPALRRRMGEAGRARAEEYFGMDHYIKRVLAVYQRALARSRQKRDLLLDPAGAAAGG